MIHSNGPRRTSDNTTRLETALWRPLSQSRAAIDELSVRLSRTKMIYGTEESLASAPRKHSTIEAVCFGSAWHDPMIYASGISPFDEHFTIFFLVNKLNYFSHSLTHSRVACLRNVKIKFHWHSRVETVMCYVCSRGGKSECDESPREVFVARLCVKCDRRRLNWLRFISTETSAQQLLTI